MQNFEHDLCTTVDAILDILGYKPTYQPGKPARPQRIDLQYPPPLKPQTLSPEDEELIEHRV